MAEIPLPPSSKKSDDSASNADCEKYDPIMGGYCKYYVTKTGECMIEFNLCDGFGTLKK
ncbi:MAG: hypothetical protein HeimAB125_01860 [Candidatus Heimdallarchaeota archaeon AB_125]|nr:MAG: hypothetical protein HeimAB125_01860 [Candidatus Heimdallarchaeota archaeon AB_125]